MVDEWTDDPKYSEGLPLFERMRKRDRQDRESDVRQGGRKSSFAQGFFLGFLWIDWGGKIPKRDKGLVKVPKTKKAKNEFSLGFFFGRNR